MAVTTGMKPAGAPRTYTPRTTTYLVDMPYLSSGIRRGCMQSRTRPCAWRRGRRGSLQGANRTFVLGSSEEDAAGDGCGVHDMPSTRTRRSVTFSTRTSAAAARWSTRTRTSASTRRCSSEASVPVDHRPRDDSTRGT
jgi:hypothetical protein